MFMALMGRRAEGIRISFLPVAQLTSIYVNAHLKEGVEKTTPFDFVPGTKAPVQTPEVAAIFAELELTKYAEYQASLERHANQNNGSPGSAATVESGEPAPAGPSFHESPA